MQRIIVGMKLKALRQSVVCLVAAIAGLVGTSAMPFDAATTPTAAEPAPQDRSKKPTHNLAAVHAAGDLSRVKAVFEVRGDLKISANGKVTKLPLTIVGTMAFDEKVLAVKRGAASRAVRHYDTAEADIKIDDKAPPRRTLEDSHRLLVAVSGASEDRRTILFSPRGPLSREELDLVTLPGDSLSLDRLLPTDGVAVGDTWKPSPEALAQLFDLDEVGVAEAQGLLTDVADDVARFDIAGTIHGAVAGVSTEIELKAKGRFDTKQRRITWFAMSFKENRSIGHVGPGIEATSRLQVEIARADAAPRLADEALVGLPLEPKDELVQLAHSSAERSFELHHDRRWHVVHDDPKGVAMRLIDRGELVAQVNVSALPKKRPGNTATLDQFQDDVKRALGASFGQFVKVTQRGNHRDYRVYRVEVLGKSGDLPIQWIYYYLADKEGRNVALAFTLEPRLTEQFSAADAALVDNLRLLDPPAKAASNANAATAK